MSERRVLIALLLLAAAAAYYVIWGLPWANDKDAKTPEKTEAEERAKADPFPATDK